MNSKAKILEMVKDGVIDVQEGVKLLEAIHEPEEQTGLRKQETQARMLRVLVDSAEGDKVRVNVPLSLIKAGVDLSKSINIGGETLDTKGIDLDLILQAIEEGATGEIVDIISEDGDTVKVLVD